jgi:hypothetical protein
MGDNGSDDAFGLLETCSLIEAEDKCLYVGATAVYSICYGSDQSQDCLHIRVSSI